MPFTMMNRGNVVDVSQLKYLFPFRHVNADRIREGWTPLNYIDE